MSAQELPDYKEEYFWYLLLLWSLTGRKRKKAEGLTRRIYRTEKQEFSSTKPLVNSHLIFNNDLWFISVLLTLGNLAGASDLMLAPFTLGSIGAVK